MVAGGYDKVINHLSKGLDIHLSTVVTKIVDKGDTVLVHTKDGEVYQASSVIVTVPLGVLQKGYITFSPAFPTKKQIAVDSLKMGNLHKTFFIFEDIFWDDIDTITIIDSQNVKIADFINVAPAFKKPILLALHAGDSAKALENLSQDELGDLAFRALQTIYPEAKKPLYTASSSWHADAFTLGSYSYVPVGASLSMYDDMAKPYGNIYFAGEHTTSEYPSTTHGAYLSGIRAAKEVQKR